MTTVVISSAFGSGNSVLKSLLCSNRTIDPVTHTCHTVWKEPFTKAGQRIVVKHNANIQALLTQYSADSIAWIKINPADIVQICQRIVVLDFLNATDTSWTSNSGAWNLNKHNALVGPDWPKFSVNIHDYPKFCLNEICETAYHRCCQWLAQPTVDWIIDSNELFGTAPPVTITKLTQDLLNQDPDLEFLQQWQTLQTQTYEQYKDLFSWTPGSISYMPANLQEIIF